MWGRSCESTRVKRTGQHQLNAQQVILEPFVFIMIMTCIIYIIVFPTIFLKFSDFVRAFSCG